MLRYVVLLLYEKKSYKNFAQAYSYLVPIKLACITEMESCEKYKTTLIIISIKYDNTCIIIPWEIIAVTCFYEK